MPIIVDENLGSTEKPVEVVVDPAVQEFFDHLAELHMDWDNLLSPPLTFKEAIKIITDLVQCARHVIGLAGQGALKKELVLKALHEADQKWHIVDIIDEAIPLPFPLEYFDGYLISQGLDAIVEIVYLVSKGDSQ